eukprot:scaffold9759_cov78-Phaeocystis_antarctica.AAC.1
MSVRPLEVERSAEASAACGASLAHPLAVDEDRGAVWRPTLPTRALSRVTQLIHNSHYTVPRCPRHAWLTTKKISVETGG